jgi:hypothetical protein
MGELNTCGTIYQVGYAHLLGRRGRRMAKIREELNLGFPSLKDETWETL